MSKDLYCALSLAMDASFSSASLTSCMTASSRAWSTLIRDSLSCLDVSLQCRASKLLGACPEVKRPQTVRQYHFQHVTLSSARTPFDLTDVTDAKLGPGLFRTV